MLRALKTGALLRGQSKNFVAAVAHYSSIPEPETKPEILYTGVSLSHRIEIIASYRVYQPEKRKKSTES